MLEIILIILLVVYAICALMGILLFAFFTDHSYYCCWLETLLIVLVQGMCAPIWWVGDSFGLNLKWGDWLEDKVLCLFDPIRKYLKKK